MQNQDAAPSELTASILLFNVSCGSGGKRATGPKLQEGIEDILKQLEDSIRDTFFLALVNDRVSNPKSTKFVNAHLVRRRESPAVEEHVDIFMNQKAKDAFDEDVSTAFDGKVSQVQQKEDTAITELEKHLKTLQLFQNRISLESYFETGDNHPLRAVHEKIKVANNIMKDSAHILKPFFLDKCSLRNFLDRMYIYVSHPIRPSDIRLLAVSWHGPYRDFPEVEEKETVFTKLVRLVERMRKEAKADVAMIGGDFNLPKDDARWVIDDLVKEHELPPATICDIEVREDRDETEDFLVAWSDRCRISFEGRAQVFSRIEKEGDGQLWPFDHPTLLHTVKLTKYDHLH